MDNAAADRLKFGGEVNLLIEDTIDQLKACPRFAGEVRQRFEEVLVQVIRFVADRANKQKGDGKVVGYLFKADASENDLEEDLMRWLSGQGLHGLKHQVIDRAAGRTDILLTYGAFDFNMELKLEASGAVSVPGATKNLGQTVAYQVTDVPLAILVVLDTSRPPDSVPPHLSDCVWVESFPPAPGDNTTRWVVVCRVVGNKRSPSALR